MTNRGKSCGRGMLRFASWKPSRRPGQLANPNCASIKQAETAQNGAAQNGDSHMDAAKNGTSQETPEGVPIPPVQRGDKPVNLLAKYNYQANPTQPGGFDELALTQGEKLEFCKAHPSNPHWWEARNEKGDVGYAPASYLMVLEQKMMVLPWLEQQTAENQQEQDEEDSAPTCTPVFKPYVSAYGNKESTNTTNNAAQYYCELCDKKLNGPIPYQVHMNSKAHKEEVAIRAEFEG